MSDFICVNAGNQPWFGHSNAYRVSTCTRAKTGFGPSGCTTPPYPNGISSLDVDVKVYFTGYFSLLPVIPASIIGPITNISLYLFYEDLDIPISVYKSDPQTYNVPAGESLYQNAVAASTKPNGDLIFGGPCTPGCSHGVSNCEAIFRKAYTRMVPIGAKSFNYTIYAVDCHNNGASEKYTFYILYDTFVDNGGNLLAGFDIYLDGAVLFVDCNGTLNLTGVNPTSTPGCAAGFFEASCNHQVKVSAARVIL